MKFYRILPVLCCVATVLAASCKKEDPISTTYSMKGSMKASLPQYVEAGYTQTFDVLSLSTLTREDGGTGIGYYFTAPITVHRDTVRYENETEARQYTFVAPDSLGTFSLIMSAYSEDHYGQSVTMTFTVVRKGINGKASISNFDVNPSDRTFTDPRDGKEYYYTTIDGVDWMRQNLAWEGAGHPYANYSVLSGVFGQFYNWNEALVACPKGWRLPSDDDWIAMSSKFSTSSQKYGEIKNASGRLMENIHFNYERMWTFERYVSIDNRARLSLIPSGFASSYEGVLDFKHYTNYAALWTSDSNGDTGGFRYIHRESDDVHFGFFDKEEFYMPVRCIRESTEN